MTPAGRVCAALAVVAALGFGWDEPTAAPAVEPTPVVEPADRTPSPLDVERALWSSLDPADRARYCAMPRRLAVVEYAGAIAEGPRAQAADRLARRIIREGCAE